MFLDYIEPNGAIQIPAQFVRTIADVGRRQARLTIAVLIVALGEEVVRKTRFPAMFLSELGATLQIAQWERNGILPHLRDVPTFAEAAKRLLKLATLKTNDPQARESDLSHQVTAAWSSQLAWSGFEVLGAEVVLGATDEDALIETVASVLWQLRKET